MMTQDSENFLCLKCAEFLKIYTDLGQTAASLHRKFNILMQDLESDIKSERDETNEISGRLQDYNNLHSDIVKSDYEIISYDNEQPQQTNSSDTIQNKIFDLDENMQTVESSAKRDKCTVRLTRIDPKTIEKYQYYSMVESAQEQLIAKKSSSNPEGKIKEVSETNATSKIINKAQNNTHICGKTSNDHKRRRFSCDLCGKSYLRKEHLHRHMKTSHIDVSCYLCSAEFESSSKLLDHKKVVHYYKSLKCEQCDAAFGKQSLLFEHVKTMHGGKRWYCHYQNCSSSFHVRNLRCYVKEHFQKSHGLQDEEIIKKYLKAGKNDQSKNKCQICGMIMNTQQALFVHSKKTHSNYALFSCDLCGQTFLHKHKVDLIDHMYKHHMKRVKFSCNLCPEEFQTNFKLMIHEKNIHNKKFKCEKCNATFIKPIDLREHVKVKHEGKRYNCQVPGCSKSYLSINSARYHLQTGHKFRGEEYRKYSAKLNPTVGPKRELDSKCHVCEKILKSRRTLTNHMKIVHKKKKSCDLCGKTFAIKRYLIEHMNTYHMEVKFQCDVCSSEFRSESKLKHHQRYSHNKNFKCDKCNLTFAYQKLLKEHVKVKHEGKRYHCSYPGCSNSFSIKASATKHLIVAH